MANAGDHPPVAPDATDSQLVTIPARARDEIGHLAFYLDQVRHNLLQINVHVTDTSQDMPNVLHELKDIVRMTESATVRVLEETEALLEEGGLLSELTARAQSAAEERAIPEISGPLGEAQALVGRSNERAMTIMSALEFQDLTTQKIQRAFEVLEEVVARLHKIHELVSLGGGLQSARPARRLDAPPADGKSGQDLADELLSRFRE